MPATATFLILSDGETRQMTKNRDERGSERDGTPPCHSQKLLTLQIHRKKKKKGPFVWPDLKASFFPGPLHISLFCLK